MSLICCEGLNLSYPSDIHHAPELAENVLDVSGVHIEDGQLASDRNPTVPEERKSQNLSSFPQIYSQCVYTSLTERADREWNY